MPVFLKHSVVITAALVFLPGMLVSKAETYVPLVLDKMLVCLKMVWLMCHQEATNSLTHTAAIITISICKHARHTITVSVSNVYATYATSKLTANQFIMHARSFTTWRISSANHLCASALLLCILLCCIFCCIYCLLYYTHLIILYAVYIALFAYYYYLHIFAVHIAFSVIIILSYYHIIIITCCRYCFAHYHYVYLINEGMLYLSKKLVASVLFDVHCFSCYLCIKQPTSLNVVYNIEGESD